MSVIYLSEELLMYVLFFLDNISNSKFIRTCKTTKKHSKIHGFLTSIVMNSPTVNDYRIFCVHSHMLRKITIKHSIDPHIWLPRCVENIVFDHCTLSKFWSPGKDAYVVKTLKITDYLRYKTPTPLRITWSCFQNLERLELYVYSVNRDGLDKLPKLKHVKINVMNE